MNIWAILLIGGLVIAIEIIGVSYWNILADKDNLEKYQPYLDSLSCDKLRDIILISNNYTLVKQAKINAERCI